MEDTSYHAGHRQRVRARFDATGDLQGWSDADVLELLLFSCIPRADTKALAHRLIDAFGSLHGVLDAPRGALLSVPGVGEAVASFLKLMPAVTRRYLDSFSADAVLSSPADCAAFFRPRMTALRTETLLLAGLDPAGRVTKCTVLAAGRVDRASLDARLAVTELLGCGADAAVLCHNHPDGVCAPSREDVALTRRLAGALALVDVRLVEHVIFAGDDWFAFSSAEKTRAALTPPDDF